MSCKIHPTAIVDPQAKLGTEVEVGPYSIIGPDVKLGDRCQVGPHVVIDRFTTIGPESVIFQFASIGAPPQDLKFCGEPSTLVLGEKNIIREYVTLQPGTAHGNMTTVIGDRNMFMANSHVGHDCVIGDGNIFANSVSLAGHVTIGNKVILGGLVAIHQFCRVGDFAMLGGGAMVANDIPPYCIGQGDRCQLRGVNAIGLQRAGFSEDQVRAAKKVYRILFATIGNPEEKIAGIPQELLSQPLVKMICEFVVNSERGIAKPAKVLSEV